MLKPIEVDVLVIGAGPVGLLAALSAKKRGLSVCIVDEHWRGHELGHAALLHGASLQLLHGLGVNHALSREAEPIEGLDLHLDGEIMALGLEPAAHTLPQSALERALLTALRQEEVEVLSAHRAVQLEQTADGVQVELSRREQKLVSPATPDGWEDVERVSVRAAFVVGADGYESTVRARLGIPVRRVRPVESYVMFEFPGDHDLAGRITLVFADELGSALLPLPAGRARATFQIETGLDRPPDLDELRNLTSSRASFFPKDPGSFEWSAVMHFDSRIVETFGRGRVFLAGDAAHVTSPLGAHSLNVGLLEADRLIELMHDVLERRASVDALTTVYSAECRERWQLLLGGSEPWQLLPGARPILATYASRLASSLPASGPELFALLGHLGLRLG